MDESGRYVLYTVLFFIALIIMIVGLLPLISPVLISDSHIVFLITCIAAVIWIFKFYVISRFYCPNNIMLSIIGATCSWLVSGGIISAAAIGIKKLSNIECCFLKAIVLAIALIVLSLVVSVTAFTGALLRTYIST